MSSLFVIFFLGGGSSVFEFSLLNNSFINVFINDLCFGLKTIFIVFWFIFVRANLPRFRFDQLMFIG
jgi:NADH-quinone oxidoreductase subunit H